MGTRINFRVHKSKNSFTMVYISPIGRDWGSTVNWDSLGKLYASIAIIWTVILALGSAWLIQNRQLPFLRMRNIPLAITSVCFLHVYLIKILLAYTTNGHFLCSAEFWIMSIYLPFGIALFQANMVQLLSISTQQRKLLVSDRASIRERRRPRFSIFVMQACTIFFPIYEAYHQHRINKAFTSALQK